MMEYESMKKRREIKIYSLYDNDYEGYRGYKRENVLVILMRAFHTLIIIIRQITNNNL